MIPFSECFSFLSGCKGSSFGPLKVDRLLQESQVQLQESLVLTLDQQAKFDFDCLAFYLDIKAHQ